MALGRSLDTPSLRLIRLGLALASVAACAALGLETVLAVPDAASSPEPPRRERLVPTTVPAASVDTAALVAQIAERPLFSPGRRPPPPAAPAAVVEIAKPDWNWRLAGLMIAPGRREALFLRQGEQRSVGEGQEIDGWTLASVRADGVTLEGDDGTKTLIPELQATTIPAARAAAANRKVVGVLQQQRKDIAAAEGMLAAASKKMLAGTGRKPVRP